MNNTKRNWKTSVFGAIMLAMAGFSIYTDPAKATDPGAGNCPRAPTSPGRQVAEGIISETTGFASCRELRDRL